MGGPKQAAPAPLAVSLSHTTRARFCRCFSPLILPLSPTSPPCRLPSRRRARCVVRARANGRAKQAGWPAATNVPFDPKLTLPPSLSPTQVATRPRTVAVRAQAVKQVRNAGGKKGGRGGEKQGDGPFRFCLALLVAKGHSGRRAVAAVQASVSRPPPPHTRTLARTARGWRPIGAGRGGEGGKEGPRAHGKEVGGGGEIDAFFLSPHRSRAKKCRSSWRRASCP